MVDKSMDRTIIESGSDEDEFTLSMNKLEQYAEAVLHDNCTINDRSLIQNQLQYNTEAPTRTQIAINMLISLRYLREIEQELISTGHLDLEAFYHVCVHAIFSSAEGSVLNPDGVASIVKKRYLVGPKSGGRKRANNFADRDAEAKAIFERLWRAGIRHELLKSWATAVVEAAPPSNHAVGTAEWKIAVKNWTGSTLERKISEWGKALAGDAWLKQTATS